MTASDRVGSQARQLTPAILGLVSITCTTAQTVTPPPPPNESVPETAIVEDELPSRASWRFHPRDVAAMHDRMTLEDGSVVLVGEQGQRWWTPNPKAKETGATATIYLAPEALEQVVKGRGDRFFLLGASGVVYESKGPISPILSESEAPERLTQLAVIDGQLLGTGALGTLFRQDEGRWLPITTHTPVFAIAARNGKEVLGLSFPEQLLSSTDRGETWTTLKSPRFAALELHSRSGGRIHIEGLSKSFEYDGEQFVQSKSLKDAPPAPPVAQRGPDAQALVDRRAALDGFRYHEAVEFKEGHWKLATGRIDEPLTFNDPPKDGARCDSVRIAAKHGHLAYACIKREFAPQSVIRLRTFSTADRGKSWKKLPPLYAADTRQIAIAIRSSGSLWMSGVCPKAKCKPRAPIIIDHQTIKTTMAPELTGTAGLTVWSNDESTSYFLGERVKDRKVALFMSRDNKSFTARALAVPQKEKQSGRWLLHMSEDGELSVTVNSRGNKPIYALLDEDGSILSRGQMPKGAIAVSASGGRVFAVGRDLSERGVRQATAWRSTDAGLSFSQVDFPAPIPYDELDIPATIWCASAACIIGRSLSRLVWQAPAEEEIQDTWRNQGQASMSSSPPFGRTANCRVRDEIPWRTVDNTFRRSLPHVQRAAQGRSMWSALRYEPENGLVEWVSMPHDGEKLVRYRLLNPVADRTAVAIEIAPQMEGYAAARISTSPENDTPFGAINVGWVNAVTNTQARARVDLSSALRRRGNDIARGLRPNYLPGWISVSPRALLLRPSRGAALTIRVNPNGSWQRLNDYPSWPAVPDGWSVQSDAVMIDSTELAMGMAAHKRASTVLFGKPLNSQSASLVATSLAPPSSTSRQTATQWTYKGSQVGAAVTIFDSTTRRSRAYYAPFTTSGTIGKSERLSSFAKLSPNLRSCTENERKTSTRYVAPAIQRERHLLAVDTPSNTMKFELRQGVFYGTANSPCVAAWQAGTLERKSTQRLIIAGHGEGWIFKTTSNGFKYRAISCALRDESKSP